MIGCNLRVITWNANGLTERRQELETFLHTEMIDIALISETRFTAKSYVAFKNYTIHNTNHPSGNSHGGSAVIIKSTIKHYLMEEYRTEKIQATTITIVDNKGDTMISAVYCPPRHNISDTDFETFFTTMGTRFISGGDWNSKHTHWGSRLINPRGRQLYRVTERRKLETLTGSKPTYWPTDRNKIPDLLDFFITKNIDRNRTNTESVEDLSSDHTPVILTINTTVALSQPPIRIYNLKNTDWETYRNIIHTDINLRNKIKTVEDLENEIEQLNITIHRAANIATPKNKGIPPKNNVYPKYIREKILERRRLRKIWQTTRYPRDKALFNKCSEKLKSLINELNNTNLQIYLATLTPTLDTNYSLWKATKKMKKPETPMPPIRNSTGGWARSNLEKAIAFAENLESVFQPFQDACEDHTEAVKSYLETATQMCLPLRNTTLKEVLREVRQLQEGKAPGYDLIDATLLKRLPHKGYMGLVKIYNACLRLAHFPGQWKIAQVVMVPKPGKPPQETNSYRPISLLPVAGKLLEKILLNRMKEHLDSVIPGHQFGFREKHGTIEQVHRTVDVISRCLENGMYCSAAFLDISQAFDKVWHEGLIYKLKKSLPHSFLHILTSYLSKRSFQVKHNNECSELYNINSGVPQGSILGPILYLIYTADLPTKGNTMTATYADDTALLSTSTVPETASTQLQAQLNDIEEWLKLWRIKANQSKSTHVTFTLKKDTCPPVTLYNQEIPQQDHAKYLGMHLDRRLTWQKHIWTKRKQLDSKLRSLYWLTGHHSQLNNNSKMMVYKAIIKPIWTYGIQLWGTASNSNVEILERFQSKTLRSMFNIPKCISNKYIYQDLNIKTVKQEITQFSIKYQNRLSQHVNKLAMALSGEGGLQHKRLKRSDIPALSSRFA